VDFEDVCTDTFLKVPNANGAIRRRGDKRIAIVKSRGPNSALMTVKGLEKCACKRAVDFDGFVVECYNDAVCVEDEGCYDAVSDLDACGVRGCFSWLGMVVRAGDGGGSVVVGGYAELHCVGE